jgi:N-methylhydantoinase A
MGYRLGVDVGGTFTDLVLYDEATRALRVEKVPSVPADPSRGILDGIVALLRAAGVPAGDIDYVAHGTTVATNTLLQRNGARTALVTTRGFRDLLEIARQKRPSLYVLSARKPSPLVPRHRRFELGERVMADGRVRRPVDAGELERLVDAIASEAAGDEPIEALAICFLYSFLAPEHERQVVERVRARLPALAVAASHEVHPEFREYERMSTTVASAYLGPRMSSYVRAFRERVAALGIAAAPYINQSNGGTMSIEEAVREPVRTVLSGPSAGVAGAAWIAARAGFSAIATFDMGGTSTDVAFVRDGAPALAFEREIGGVTLRVPTLDIHTVGAGGGSIAWRDSGGALKVGPHSAGADPGPACYGRGGRAPTVTDASVLLGRLAPSGLLGGALPLDPARAEAAVTGLAGALGLSVLEAARGIVHVVNANMANAVRVVTVQRGIDPAGLVLVPFGGAGPLHAGELARELGIPVVAVPPSPGLLCALGLLVEDLRTDAVRTFLAPLEADALPALAGRFEEMERAATAWLDRERVAPARRRLERWLDLRYVGQNFELLVPVPGEVWRDRDLAPLRRRFLVTHEQVYGFAADSEPIQVVNMRLVARGVPDPPNLAAARRGPADPDGGCTGRRPVYVDARTGFADCPVYRRDRLCAGQRIAGPAMIEQFDATTWLGAGESAEVDEIGFLVVRDRGR